MAAQSDLLDLLLLPNETLSNEYKSWLDLTDTASKAVLAKAAIALANHGGGVIVVGMRGAQGSTLESQPMPDNVKRYDPDAVNAAVNRYADPKIHCDLQFATHPGTGIEHAFITVPGTSVVPVMSARDYEKVIASQRCYIRKPGPKSEEPFTSEEWRSLLSRCVQAGREALLDGIRTILQGQALEVPTANETDQLAQFASKSRERWESLIAPLPVNDPARFSLGSYEQAFQLLDVPAAAGLGRLRDRLDEAGNTVLTGWGPFVNLRRPPIGPIPVNDGIEAWVGHPKEEHRSGRHCDFWRAEITGLMYEIRSFDEDFSEKVSPGTGIDLTLPIWRVGETLLFVARVAKQFEEDPEIAIRIQYSGLQGRELKSLFDWRAPLFERDIHVDTIVLQGRAKASQILDTTSEVVLPLLRPLYEAFGFYELKMELVASELARLRKGT
ncbi:putative DNA-binding protein [Mesorhizobium loti]|uniref:Putative DNA-binding protein n=1 Tax=Rhizobium loti TaxID=381 RepID=A0A8E3B368_RHILI|nr:RNA-binding domain-containing protein [Mesorhizobium loti]PWJ89534.1 putative DNA-binding protein [Mesorhizobium loti]